MSPEAVRDGTNIAVWMEHERFVFKAAASGYDTVQTNTIGLSFGRVTRDLSYLEITADDYRRAAAEVIAANELFWRAERQPGTRAMTPEEIADQEERSRLAHVLGLRIDTLYFVGQRLLDSVAAAADTVLSPRHGRPRGVRDLGRHRTVRHVLEERIRTGIAPPASPSLFEAMAEVTPIKDYRDDHVILTRRRFQIAGQSSGLA
jgi:hypothetical protein